MNPCEWSQKTEYDWYIPAADSCGTPVTFVGACTVKGESSYTKVVMSLVRNGVTICTSAADTEPTLDCYFEADDVMMLSQSTTRATSFKYFATCNATNPPNRR